MLLFGPPGTGKVHLDKIDLIIDNAGSRSRHSSKIDVLLCLSLDACLQIRNPSHLRR